jgi:hypothetical protein
MKNKHLLTLLMFCFISFGTGNTFAQGVSKKKPSPLIFKLSTPTKTVCLGAKEIELNLEITNVSEKPVAIDRNYLWNGTISGDFIKNGKVEFSWIGGRMSVYPYTANYYKINPEQKYHESYNYSFLNGENLNKEKDEDKEISERFSRVGTIALSFRYYPFGYGEDDEEIKKWYYKGKAIYANKLKFRIADCSSKKK